MNLPPILVIAGLDSYLGSWHARCARCGRRDWRCRLLRAFADCNRAMLVIQDHGPAALTDGTGRSAFLISVLYLQRLEIGFDIAVTGGGVHLETRLTWYIKLDVSVPIY